MTIEDLLKDTNLVQEIKYMEKVRLLNRHKDIDFSEVYCLMKSDIMKRYNIKTTQEFEMIYCQVCYGFD